MALQSLYNVEGASNGHRFGKQNQPLPLDAGRTVGFNELSGETGYSSEAPGRAIRLGRGQCEHGNAFYVGSCS